MANSDANISEYLQEKMSRNYQNLRVHTVNLGQFQQGVLSTVFLLVSLQIAYTCCFTQTFFILAIFNVVRFFMTFLCIFSFYTWLMLIYGKNWSDTTIYILFLISFSSEFLSQWFFYNNTINVNNNMKDNELNANESMEEDYSYLTHNAHCTMMMGCLCTFLIYLSNFYRRVENSFIFMLTTCLIRFYGSIYFSNVVPVAVSAYFSYVCAFCGCVFSHHVNKHLKKSDSNSNIINNSNEQDIVIAEKRQNQKLSNSRRNKASNGNFSISNNFNFKRRTSLPIIPIRFDKCCFPDNLLLNEIQNQINDILNNNDEDILSDHIFKSLRVVNNLIVQAKMNSESSLNEHNSQKKVIKADNIKNTRNNNNNNNNEKKSSNKNENNNNITSKLQKRFSLLNSSFKEAMKQDNLRNSKNQKFNHTRTNENWINNFDDNIQNAKNTSANNLTDDQNIDHLYEASTQIKMLNILNNLIKYNEDSDNISTHQTQLNINHQKGNQNVTKNENMNGFNKSTSDYESGESPNSSDCNSDTDKLQLKEYHKNNRMIKIKEELIDHKRKKCLNTKQSTVEDIKKIDLLENIDDWNFPIFELYEKANYNILSHMAYKIFDKVGLFNTFNIPINLFMNYFNALENGYNDLPYHNRIHAADILHACYFLTNSDIPNFVQSNPSNYKPNLKSRNSLNFQCKDFSKKFGCLGTSFTPLEILALYCSAAMHDYEHPGRNNQFMVAVESPLALLYNDKSVLENHHAASSWSLLKSDAQYNFLSNLEVKEWKRFRTLVVENILATDLSKHFSLIAEFDIKVKNKKTPSNPLNTSNISHSNKINYGGIDWNTESDRLLVGQMIIKLSDINAPLKEKNLHIQWTQRICEEFYQQGEEEAKLSLPISPHMDRTNPKMPKLQESFINILVGSLCNAYSSARLLPGIIIEDTTNANIENTNESSKKPKKFFSELSNNLKVNYDMWCQRIRQDEDQEKIEN